MDWIREATTSFLIISFFLLLIYRKKLGKTTQIFTLAIAIMSIVNVFSAIYRRIDTSFNSTPYFVVGVSFFSFLLFYIYFYKLLKLKQTRMLQLFTISMFVATFAIVGIIEGKDFFLQFPSYFYLFQTILLMFSITLFFYETFNSDIILNIKDYFPFWVCLSLIIIYVGILPVLFFIQSDNFRVNRNVFIIVMFFINLIGYGILSYGILRSKKSSNLMYE